MISGQENEGSSAAMTSIEVTLEDNHRKNFLASSHSLSSNTKGIVSHVARKVSGSYGNKT